MRLTAIAMLSTSLLLASAACGDDDEGDPDAFVFADAARVDAEPPPPDAEPETCLTPGFTAGSMIHAGASADLFGRRQYHRLRAGQRYALLFAQLAGQ